jgi:hypothetical protein
VISDEPEPLNKIADCSTIERQRTDSLVETSMATGHIDFWFTMGSSYSYLSVMRLLEVERSTGIGSTGGHSICWSSCRR